MLTEKELELVLDLLEAESNRLAIETRHTDLAHAKKQIRERERAVDRLLERLREMKAGELSKS